MPLIRKTGDRPPPSAPTRDEAAALLAGGDADARWQAARTLGGIADGGDALAAALGHETDPRVREAIFTSLVRIGDDASVDAMIRALRSDDANLRSGALDALRVTPGASRARLPALLSDADPDVRLLACELGRDLPSDEATRLLSALLDREGEANVCAAAVDVLAEIGDAQALPALGRCGARFGDQPFLRFAIDAAARRIGSERPPHVG
jgi:HEAT repeat protein